MHTTIQLNLQQAEDNSGFEELFYHELTIPNEEYHFS